MYLLGVFATGASLKGRLIHAAELKLTATYNTCFTDAFHGRAFISQDFYIKKLYR